ncbi:hypothetical protein [Alteribacillus sp. HJP-4]|uniref:hypothetical protein n=1 Tax=Alteribacillus sp. HJP-4 TaxID=2775394 RepID=UPI0035CCEF5F
MDKSFAFRGACLQLILPQRSFGRMDFQTSLIPTSPPSILQSKNKHHKGDYVFFVMKLMNVKDGRMKKLGQIKIAS